MSVLLNFIELPRRSSWFYYKICVILLMPIGTGAIYRTGYPKKCFSKITMINIKGVVMVTVAVSVCQVVVITITITITIIITIAIAIAI